MERSAASMGRRGSGIARSPISRAVALAGSGLLGREEVAAAAAAAALALAAPVTPRCDVARTAGMQLDAPVAAVRDGYPGRLTGSIATAARREEVAAGGDKGVGGGEVSALGEAVRQPVPLPREVTAQYSKP
jgi:hypothetical protein